MVLLLSAQVYPSKHIPASLMPQLLLDRRPLLRRLAHGQPGSELSCASTAKWWDQLGLLTNPTNAFKWGRPRWMQQAIRDSGPPEAAE